MFRRFFIIPITLVLISISACSVPDENANGSNGPQTTEPKTKAELLIGTWRLVKTTPPRDWLPEMTDEYTSDGRIISTIGPIPAELPAHPFERVRRIEKGKYWIEGEDSFFVLMDNMKENLGHYTIRTITNEKLITYCEIITSDDVNGSPDKIYEFERQSKK
jgi:hypothetical protein